MKPSETVEYFLRQRLFDGSFVDLATFETKYQDLLVRVPSYREALHKLIRGLTLAIEKWGAEETVRMLANMRNYCEVDNEKTN